MSRPKASAQIMTTACAAPAPGAASGPRAPADWLEKLRLKLDPAERIAAPDKAAGHGDEGRERKAAPRRPAAVLAPLIEREGELHVILTVRPQAMPTHAGQISFPGGRAQRGDADLAATALRETHEEIGVSPDRIELLGRWEPYETVTGFHVTPFAGLVKPGADPVACPREVAEIFTAPLAFLMDPANTRRETREFAGMSRRFYAMPFGDYYIWGATAGMLRLLQQRLAD